MIDTTILMTVHNGMPYLEQSIQSIKDQTYQDWQFVIVDDGSTDESAAFLDSIEDVRFTIIHQENQGTAVAANHGLQYCDTEFVARMDDDDISLPSRLAEQIDFLRAHPDVGLVGAQMAPLGAQGVGHHLELPTDHDEITDFMRSGRHGLAHSCITMRTQLVKELGGYWQYDLNDAWDLMLRMGEIAKVANLDKVLHHYRVHEGSQNGKAMRKMRFSIDYACELSRRRRAGEEAITPDEFAMMTSGQPLLKRCVGAIELHARTQYRLALAECHGTRRLFGLLRLGWSAACAPHLAIDRLKRSIRYRRRGSSNSPADC